MELYWEAKMMRQVALFLLCIVWLVSAGPAHAQSGPVTLPSVYVADFDLEAEDVHQDQGLLPHPLGRQGPGSRIRSMGKGDGDPQKQAREIIDLMSDSLVKDLMKLGYSCRRVEPGEHLPGSGILLRGLFANVDEGNRLRRAAIGFGAGHTDVQVIVSVSNLGAGSVQPFYEVNSGAKKGKMPGAVITMNPYVAAAKFVLAGKDMKKGVTQAASNIATAVDKQVRSPEAKTGAVPLQSGR
jgi:hypothetical protein